MTGRLTERIRLALSAALFCLLVTGASAKTVRIDKSVQAGTNTKIDHYTGWKPDCSFLTIKINVTKAPEHGQVTHRLARSTITHAEAGSVGSCSGKPTRILELYYKSAGGFRGVDHVSVDMLTPGQAPVTFVYTISVH